jgi:hypothetical protein
MVEKPPINSVRFCGGGQDLSWAVELREEEEEATVVYQTSQSHGAVFYVVVTLY